MANSKNKEFAESLKHYAAIIEKAMYIDCDTVYAAALLVFKESRERASEMNKNGEYDCLDDMSLRELKKIIAEG